MTNVESRRKRILAARLQDTAATAALWALAGFVVLTLALISGYILVRGWGSVNLSFLTSASKSVGTGGGIGSQIFDSFYMLVLSMAVTAPLGLGAAVYVSEYARDERFKSAIRLAAETLASLPSIIAGLFGMLVFVMLSGWGYSIAAGALTLTVLNLPVAFRISEEAVRAVPKELREASLALGASRWQTVTRVVVPAALPGILTGLVLTSGRVFGEAAALLFTAGMASPPLNWHDLNPLNFRSPLNPFRPAETLAVHIWKINSESLITDVRRVADGSALVLLAIVFASNLLAKRIGTRLMKR